MQAGLSNLALVFAYAHDDYLLIVNAFFASAKPDFENTRMEKAAPATPPHKSMLGASGTSVSAGATAVGAGMAAEGPLHPQHQITLTVRHPFAKLIPPQGDPRFPVESQSQPTRASIHSNLPSLLDSSLPSNPVPFSQWPNILQPSMPHPNSAASPKLNLSPAVDLSGNHQTAPTLEITPEHIAQAGTTGVASNSSTLLRDLSGIQLAVGDPANMVPTA